MRFKANNPNDPEMVKAAEIATVLINRPDINAQVERETIAEYARQVFYGMEPSEGIPDIRPHYPRFQA
jgi:hypothetical protein